MRHALLGIAAVLLVACGADRAAAPRVVLETSLGEIELELDDRRAPATTANFLRYVEAGFYDGGRFHRTVTLENQPQNPVKIEVIQAGPAPARGAELFPPIALERTRDTGLRHTDGAVSMARLGPDTAQAEFFICIGDQPELDFGGRRNPDGQGFAAFGRVVRGLDVVRRIQRAPHEEQRLTPPVEIRRARRTR
jgi:peptidyl-prolyl cis-trans isomerase A (cyclophilin A)